MIKSIQQNSKSSLALIMSPKSSVYLQRAVKNGLPKQGSVVKCDQNICNHKYHWYWTTI